MTDKDPADADDVAWLEAREHGASLPALDPMRAAAYERIAALIVALPDRPAPHGWQDAVTASLPAGRATDVPVSPGVPATRTPRGRRRWLAAAAAVVVAALALLIVRGRREPDPVDRLPLSVGTSPAVSLRVTRAHTTRSGDEIAHQAAIGDRLEVEARGVVRGELRIYRNDREIVLRCPQDPACSRSASGMTAALTVTAPGRYRAVYFEPAPSVAPSGTLETDLSTCQCQTETSVPIVVR